MSAGLGLLCNNSRFEGSELQSQVHHLLYSLQGLISRPFSLTQKRPHTSRMRNVHSFPSSALRFILPALKSNYDETSDLALPLVSLHKY